MRRRKKKPVQEKGGASAPPDSLKFIPSGCTVFDCALGGGYALGRMVNIVGDKSTGKTLLCIEACANFVRSYPKGKIYYREIEAAFDKSYAAALGMPIDKIDFGDDREFFTVEDIFEDLDRILKRSKGRPALYIIDSLDALSDRAEQDRDIAQGNYGTNKAKQMSELFRRLNKKISQSNMTLIIVSQVRDKIGAMFGRKTSRSGGRAIDFYASQIIYLAHMKTLKRTIKGVQRPTGIRIKAKVDKNKVGLPFREVEFEIHFGFGIDDLGASLDWLREVRKWDSVKMTSGRSMDTVKNEFAAMSDSRYSKRVSILGDRVRRIWNDVENTFLPARRKYNDGSTA